jgi:peptide/nickel transport system substrate-binding protein
LKEKARTLTSVIMSFLLISILATLFPTTVLAPELPRNETLIISSDWSQPVGYNPLMQRPAYFTNLMYPSLYINSPYSDEWIPYIAKSFMWADKYTLVVTIKDEAKWWDGQPILAEDVKYSLELGKPDVGNYSVPMYTPQWTYVENVTVIGDPATSKVVALFLNVTMLNYFSALNVLWQPLILPKHRWQNLVAQYGADLTTAFRDDVPANIIGAGPYKLMAEDRPNMLIYAERVDKWWGKDIFGVPNPKYLVSIGFLTNDAANAAFTAGTVDMCSHMIPEIWTLFSTGVRTYYPTSPYFVSQGPVVLNLNYLKKGLDNPTVRRAIAYALPIADMVSGPYYNYSVPCVPVPIIHTGPAATYINQSLVDQYGWTYNLTKAKQILDDAGIVDTDADGYRDLPDGTDLKGFTIQVPNGWADWMACCELIASNLDPARGNPNAIGIGVTPVYPEFQPTWWNRIASGELDLFIGWSGWAPGYAHPWNSFLYFMDNRPANAFPSGNWMNYPSDDTGHGTGLIGSAAAIPLIDAIPQETDAAKLKSMYSQLEEIFLKDVVAVPLFYGAVWYEYQTTHWTGFPSADFPWFCNIFGGTPGNTGWPSQMPMLFTVKPTGQTPTTPAWVNSMKFPTSEIFEEITEAPDHAVIIVTNTVTTTVTSTTTSTTTSTSISTTTSTTTLAQATTTTTTTTTVTTPTMDITSVAGAGIVALIVGVAVGWLFASRKKK